MEDGESEKDKGGSGNHKHCLFHTFGLTPEVCQQELARSNSARNKQISRPRHLREADPESIFVICQDFFALAAIMG